MMNDDWCQVVDSRRVRATVQLQPGQTISIIVASLTSFDTHGSAFAKEPLRTQVSFQWKNPDFLSKNPDFLFRNPGFLLKNVELLIQTSGCAASTPTQRL